MSAQFEKIRADVTKKLHEPNQFTNILAKIEEKTGCDRFYIVCGAGGFFALYLIFGYFAELVCNLVGFAYPAYASIKAIESSNKEDDTQVYEVRKRWLTYWVVFGLFNCVEFAADMIVGWFPIYWLAKCILFVYLYLPATKGAENLYTKVVQPFAAKHKEKFDMISNKLTAGAEKMGGMAAQAAAQAGDIDMSKLQ